MSARCGREEAIPWPEIAVSRYGGTNAPIRVPCPPRGRPTRFVHLYFIVRCFATADILISFTVHVTRPTSKDSGESSGSYLARPADFFSRKPRCPISSRYFPRTAFRGDPSQFVGTDAAIFCGEPFRIRDGV